VAIDGPQASLSLFNYHRFYRFSAVCEIVAPAASASSGYAGSLTFGGVANVKLAYTNPSSVTTYLTMSAINTRPTMTTAQNVYQTWNLVHFATGQVGLYNVDLGRFLGATFEITSNMFVGNAIRLDLYTLDITPPTLYLDDWPVGYPHTTTVWSATFYSASTEVLNLHYFFFNIRLTVFIFILYHNRFLFQCSSPMDGTTDIWILVLQENLEVLLSQDLVLLLLKSWRRIRSEI
jgi:hypothetical protein